MRWELLALAVVLAILLLFPAALLGYQAARASVPGVRVVDLVGRAPAEGGWQPEAIRVSRGERVRLRISSADVVHGFAVPALGIEVKEVLPGHVEEVEFVAERAGRFPFTCTRWCSTDHWRMRGAIEVVEPGRVGAAARPPSTPLFQRLQIDLDAPRPPVVSPTARPSAARGKALGAALPPDLLDRDWLRAHTPADAFARLRTEAALTDYDDTAVWSLVAYAWERAVTPDLLARGEQMFRRDCAACHGAEGRGNGPAGRSLPGMAAMHADMKRGPADLTDRARMLGASDVLLQGKALRGGMGTGMPEWGSLYTEDDLWAVVAYLRSFSFDYRP